MNFQVIGSTYKIKKSELEKVAKAAFSYFPTRAGEIELKFVSEKEMTRLNHIYREINKVTDVLSFNISQSPLVGQVFICYNYARRQSVDLKKEFIDEVCLLLTHGNLNIYGYDHASEVETQMMQKIEKEILNQEGYTR